MSSTFSEVLEHLRAILSARVHKHFAQRGSLKIEFWRQPNFFLLNLGEVAHILTGRTVTSDQDVQAALFEPAALELLVSKCPSEYWFFELLLRVKVQSLPLSRAAIAQAIEEAREEFTARHDVSFLADSKDERLPLAAARIERIFPLHQAGLLLSDGTTNGDKLDWSRLVVHPLVRAN